MTSVGLSAPTGFNVTGSPITTSGTLALSFASGYELPLAADTAKGVTAYGWGDHSLAGYALASNVYSKTDADAKFLTIAFFRSLFKAYTSASAEVVPNDGDTSTISSIKAMFGFWTEQYISALGQGSGGGGGGGDLNEPLNGINNASLGSPSSAGQTLVWNGSAWKYSSATGISATSLNIGGSATISGIVTSAGGFSISGKDNTYVLLAGGGTKLLSEIGGGGAVNSITIGNNGTNYPPDANGVVTIPAYPTVPSNIVEQIVIAGTSTPYQPSSGTVTLPAYPTKSSWNYDDVYLKLSGGTLTKNERTVLNLNDTSGVGSYISFFIGTSATKAAIGYNYNNGTEPVTYISNIISSTAYSELLLKGDKLDVDFINSQSCELRLFQAGTGRGAIGYYNNTFFLSGPSGGRIGVNSSNTPVYMSAYNSTQDTLWNSGNDGSGSGLDADLLDGQHGSYYATAASLGNYLPLTGGTLSSSVRGILVLTDTSGTGSYISYNIGGSVKGAVGYYQDTNKKNTYLELVLSSTKSSFISVNEGTLDVSLAKDSDQQISLYNGSTVRGSVGYYNNTFFLATAQGGRIGVNSSNTPVYMSAYNSTQETLWHSGNDGSGSGLDADLLDGQHASNLSVASAAILTTSRTIWGQSFNGSANVTGDLSTVGCINFSESKASSSNTGGSFRIGRFDESNGGIKLQFGGSAGGLGIINAAWTLQLLSFTRDGDLDVYGTAHASKFLGNASGSHTAGYFDGGLMLSEQDSSYTEANRFGMYIWDNVLTFTRRNVSNTWLSDMLSIKLSNGYVGIGTSSPSYLLDVRGVIYSNTGVYSAGYVTALSDARRKDVQGDVMLTAEDVANAPMIKFLWKDRANDGMQVGSIAQYWQRYLPEAIVEDKDGYLTMDYGIIALLSSIATAKKVKDHERRIAELERENNELKKRLNAA